MAQQTPDFSGVYIRKLAKGHDAPLVLNISQSPQALEVTARLNGETLVTNYDFGGTLQPGGSAIKIKGKNLVIESLADFKPLKLPTTRVGVVPSMLPFATNIRTTERWALSSDLQTLTIRRKIEYLNGKDIVNTENDEDTFARRPSLDVAVMEASQVQGQCSMTPPPEQTPKNVKIKYEEGVLIGTTLFQQVSRCMLFSAALSAKKLERVFTSHGYRFLLDSKPVTTFPDVVTLEISPAPACTTGLHNAVDVRAADLEGLTFQFRWHGPGERDLETIDGKLLQDPWPELSTSENFFRLEIPAKGIPLDDSLEVHISNREGKQLGCILGHI